MPDDTPEVIDTLNLPVQDELTKLKAQATLMGIAFHPSIGVDKLRIKVNNALSDTPVPESELNLGDEDEDSAEPTPEELKEEAPVVSTIPKPTEQAAAVVAPVAPVVETPVAAPAAPVIKEEVVAPKELTVHEQRNLARAAATKMVRINVTCMNPLKKEWGGEIFTVGNNLVGTLSKYVPFDTTDGWHVPNIIYLMMKDRQFQQFSAKKNLKPGEPSSRVTKMVREFAIEVLDPLTEQELAELKQRQLMAQGAQE